MNVFCYQNLWFKICTEFDLYQVWVVILVNTPLERFVKRLANVKHLSPHQSKQSQVSVEIMGHSPIIFRFLNESIP